MDVSLEDRLYSFISGSEYFAMKIKAAHLKVTRVSKWIIKSKNALPNNWQYFTFATFYFLYELEMGKAPGEFGPRAK